MEEKKILIVSGTFYPSISPRSFRTTELAKAFARKGHEVTVLIPTNGLDYSAFEDNFNVSIKSLGYRKMSALKNPKGMIGKILVRIINRMLLQLFEYPSILLMIKINKALRKEEKYYDILISIAVPYPVHWGVAMARTNSHKLAELWVADCGDPYMGEVTDSFRKMFYFKYVEKWFSRKTDFITIPIAAATHAYYPEFHHKIRVIPQGYNFNSFVRKEKVENEINPTFAYAGSFIPDIRDPRKFLEHLCILNIEFKFIVFTNNRDLLIKFQPILKEKLIIRDYIPHDELIEFLSGMDFIVNFDNNTTVHSPSKLIDYTLTGRPILNLKKELDYDNIRKFLNGDYSGKFSFEHIENYNINNVSQSFLDLSEDC